jgi:hypothetical protein
MLRHARPAPTASPLIASLTTRPPAKAADAEASADDADSGLQAPHLDALQRKTRDYRPKTKDQKPQTIEVFGFRV